MIPLVGPLGELIERRWFHDLRRTFIRDSVEAGHDLTTAMQSTGHRTISVANRYNIRNTRLIAKAMLDTHAHRARRGMGI